MGRPHVCADKENMCICSSTRTANQLQVNIYIYAKWIGVLFVDDLLLVNTLPQHPIPKITHGI